MLIIQRRNSGVVETAAAAQEPSPRWLRLPLPRHALCLGKLVRGHPLAGSVAVPEGLVVALRGREVEPHVRQNVVLRHALACGVHDAEVGLGVGVAMVGGGGSAGTSVRDSPECAGKPMS